MSYIVQHVLNYIFLTFGFCFQGKNLFHGLFRYLISEVYNFDKEQQHWIKFESRITNVKIDMF